MRGEATATSTLSGVETAWSEQQLHLLDHARELEIATRRPDDSLRGWLPIWVVCQDGKVYLRTWHRRDTGWYGHALQTRSARVRVPGLEADVSIADVGRDEELRAAVDGAYRDKYGSGDSVGGMVSEESGATTLRLLPEDRLTSSSG